MRPVGNSILRLNKSATVLQLKLYQKTKKIQEHKTIYLPYTRNVQNFEKEKSFFWLKIVYKKKQILKTNKKIWIKLWCCRKKTVFLALSNFTYAIKMKMKIYSIYKKRREGDSVRLISNINRTAEIENSLCSRSDFPPTNGRCSTSSDFVPKPRRPNSLLRVSNKKNNKLIRYQFFQGISIVKWKENSYKLKEYKDWKWRDYLQILLNERIKIKNILQINE